jgi:4-hydroxy-tetrahydrodipicolinate synthase
MVNAIANVFPHAVAALYEAVAAGRLDEGRRLHESLWQLNKAVFFDTNPIPVKYMMSRRGLLPGIDERLPMASASVEVRRRCDAVLTAAGDLS